MINDNISRSINTKHHLFVEAALYELRDVISEGPALAHDGDVEALQPRLGQDHVILLKTEAGLAPGPVLLLVVTVV